MDAKLLELLEQIAKAIAAQFGSNCEVVLHELSGKSTYSSIVAIENGHVTGRKVGDGPSHVVLEQLGHEDDNAEDQLGYLTRTKDGKILKSSSVYIRDENGKVTGILGINYDISMMQLFENSLHDFISADQHASREPERITLNVADLLDDLIRQVESGDFFQCLDRLLLEQFVEVFVFRKGIGDLGDLCFDIHSHVPSFLFLSLYPVFSVL